MSMTYNPFTGKFDFVGNCQEIKKKDIIKAILVESNQSIALPVAAILFDDDSILFNDDEEL
jgi:hypothetical protein